MRLLPFALALCVCVGFSAGKALAVELSISIPTVAAAPPIDGTLTSPIWQQAAKVQLGYDRQTRAASAESTMAYLLTDGSALYVAFDAKQTRSGILTNQHSNNQGVDTDDEVKIALWPSGRNGINYQFIATPIGTLYQYSSENTSYEPTWQAVGKVGNNAYIVTLRIPLSIMHGARQKDWLVNLTRWEPTTGSLYAWSGGESFSGTPDQNFARPLLGMPKSVSVRPKPRIGFYTLGAIASKDFGGNTSRVGADISIPITDNIAFIAAIHPDFSNAERDQQTISPTAFRRFINEVRPFFTQGANYYNFYECDACNTEASLYTPSIPTPRDGYAIEGKQGPVTFAGFDAVGFGRTDAAQSVIVRNVPQTFYVSAQRVSVNGTSPTLPGPGGFRDNTLQLATKWDDLHHKFIYANYGTESATSNWITDPSQAKFEEIGGAWYGPYSFFGGGLRRLGAQYNPFDGFFTHATDSSGNTTAMNGYGWYWQHNWIPKGSKFKSINLNVFSDAYHAPSGLTQSDVNLQLDLVTRSQWEFTFNTGSSYFMVNGNTIPVTQESTRVTYHAGLATPTSYQFYRGRYGDGMLFSTFRSTTMKLGQRGLLSLEADDTRQYLDHAQADGTFFNHQWLERASFAYQIDPNTSLAVGVRRFFGPPPVPNGGATCFIPQPGNTNALGFCPNISFAYHRRLPQDELYVIYGDASQTLTPHQFLMKWIHYFGAQKGT
jgi:uncharacterized protein DUF5916